MRGLFDSRKPATGRQPRGVPATGGRQWDAWAADSDRSRRRHELSRLACINLGGCKAAHAFLNHSSPALAGLPISIGTASAQGQLQVSWLIMRAAAERIRARQDDLA